MNILGVYKSDILGSLLPTRTQRNQAALDITSMLRTRLYGYKASETASTAAKAAEAKADTSTSTTSATDDLDAESFLQLLMQQLSNQDPLEPMDNEDMLAQLAQFSALEQMTSLNDQFSDAATQLETLSGNIDQLNFLSAQGMIGKYVEGVNEDGDIITGMVDSVTLDGSIVVLSVDDETLPMTGVMTIAAGAPTDTESDSAKVSAGS